MCLFTNHSSYSVWIMVLLLCSYSFFVKVTTCSRCIMLTVWDIQITEALFILFLPYMLWIEFNIAEIKASQLWLLCNEIWGECFMIKFFHMVGIDAFHAVLFAYIAMIPIDCKNFHCACYHVGITKVWGFWQIYFCLLVDIG